MSETPNTEEIWTSLDLAKELARLADEKLASDIKILHVAPAIQVADYFVIAQGRNRRHLATIAENAARELKQYGMHRIGGSSLKDENWVLLDYGAVVLHVFSADGRAFYDLENLWGDCDRVEWSPPERAADADDEDEVEEDDPIPAGLAPADLPAPADTRAEE